MHTNVSSLSNLYNFADGGPRFHAGLSAISRVPPVEVLMEWHEGKVIKNFVSTRGKFMIFQHGGPYIAQRNSNISSSAFIFDVWYMP